MTTVNEPDGTNFDESSGKDYVQYSTFLVGDRLYGIDVKRVQEVVKPMPMTQIPLAPNYIRGLINLRGQVATAIGLREMFDLTSDKSQEMMNVVCRVGDTLISMQVDEIGDVVELHSKDFESTPTTIPTKVRRYMKGVYKTKDNLLSILSVDRIMKFVNEA